MSNGTFFSVILKGKHFVVASFELNWVILHWHAIGHCKCRGISGVLLIFCCCNRIQTGLVHYGQQKFIGLMILEVESPRFRDIQHGPSCGVWHDKCYHTQGWMMRERKRTGIIIFIGFLLLLWHHPPMSTHKCRPLMTESLLIGPPPDKFQNKLEAPLSNSSNRYLWMSSLPWIAACTEQRDDGHTWIIKICGYDVTYSSNNSRESSSFCYHGESHVLFCYSNLASVLSVNSEFSFGSL